MTWARTTEAEKRVRTLLAVVSVALLFTSVGVGIVPEPVAAAPSDVVSTATLGDGVAGLDPNRTTPVEAEVWAIENVGGLMLVGGAFLQVRDRSTYGTIARPYLAAFDPSTGDYVPWFRTQTDGPVYDIADLGDGRVVIAGEFRSVNGVPGTANLAIIDVTTGRVDTRYRFDFVASSAESVVRAVAVSGGALYVTGGFEQVTAGGVQRGASGLAKIDLGTGRLDTGFTATLQRGGGWDIDADPATGRVVVGGRFGSVNDAPGTGTLAALEPNGSLVSGWNHGFPHAGCNATFVACGAVNGLAIAGGRVFVAGAKHFWSALDLRNGQVLADRTLTNDGQSVELIDGQIVIGCHCETSGVATEFNGIAHRYVRVIDPATMSEVFSPTVNSRGAAGGWAADSADDGCLWTGGNFSSTFVGDQRHPAWSLLRFCPSTVGNNPALAEPPVTDTSPPAVPAAPTISAVAGATVTISWPTVAENQGQVIYLVYRNGELVSRTASNQFSDRLLAYNSTYVWQVAAMDVAGNMTSVSASSAPVRIGPRVNVARRGTAVQSGDFDATTGAERAIDGNISGDPSRLSISRTMSRAQLGGLDSWWGLDLGQVHHVDTVEIHPRRDAYLIESNNRTRLFRSTEPIDITSFGDGAGLRLWVADVVRRNQPRIDTVPVAEPVRYLRLFAVAPRTSFAEIRVFTTFPQPTPAAPPADVTSPSGPRWSRTDSRGNVTVLSWGGASDDRAVAYYEVYRDGLLVRRTSEGSALVGPAGGLAADYVIVAFDSEGNPSAEVPEPPGAGVPDCAFVRNGTSVSVTWSPTAGADSYVVFRSVNGSPWFWRGRVADGDRFEDTDREGEIVYRVASRSGTELSDPTECSAGDETAPPPKGLRVTRTERRTIVLNYQGNRSAVEIQRDGFVVGIETDDWFVDSELKPGSTHTYRVRFADNGEWSDPVSVTLLL